MLSSLCVETGTHALVFGTNSFPKSTFQCSVTSEPLITHNQGAHAAYLASSSSTLTGSRPTPPLVLCCFHISRCLICGLRSDPPASVLLVPSTSLSTVSLPWGVKSETLRVCANRPDSASLRAQFGMTTDGLKHTGKPRRLSTVFGLNGDVRGLCALTEQ